MKIRKTLGAGVLSLGLVVGLAGFASAAPGSGSISDSGAHSYNKVTQWTSHRVMVSNDNDLHATNNNTQTAYTGVAVTKDNHTAGAASTGSATNTNSLNASVAVNNAASSAAAMPAPSTQSSTASITDSGAHSYNKVTSVDTSSTFVDNDNTVSVTNNNTQSAVSGAAIVKDNHTAGDAVSGDATNSNSTTISFNVSN